MAKTPKKNDEIRTAGVVLGESFANSIRRTPVFGNMATTAMAGGSLGGVAMAGGIGLAASVVGQFKSVFVDPIINAITGGFQTGVNKGMGLDVLSRSAEYLGVVIGGMLSPAIIRLSALLLTFGDRFKQSGNKLEESSAKYLDWYQKYLGWLPSSRILGLDDWRGTVKKWNSDLANNDEYKKNLLLVKDTLKMSLLGGQKAAYTDLSNIREQIQIAAQEDPLTKKFRELITQQIEEIDKKIAEWLRIANNQK